MKRENGSFVVHITFGKIAQKICLEAFRDSRDSDEFPGMEQLFAPLHTIERGNKFL